MAMTGIEAGYYLSGGTNIVNAIWSKPNLAIAKRAFIANGFTNDTLHKALLGFDFYEHGPRIANKRYILAVSTHDNVVDFAEASRNFKSRHKTNPDSRLIIYKRYNHWQAIVRGLVGARSTISFFRK